MHRFSAEYIFAREFTDHYDEFAQYFPEFGHLREFSKIALLVNFLRGLSGVSMLYALLKKNDFSSSIGTNEKSSSLKQIIWNREYMNLNRPAHVKNSEGNESYSLYYVHGHDTDLNFSSGGYIFNLDNQLGKNYYRVDDMVSDYAHKGIYRVLRIDFLEG